MDKNNVYHTGYQFGQFLHGRDSDLDFKEIDIATREFLEQMGESIDLTNAEKSDHFYAGVVNGYTLGVVLEEE